MTKEDWLKKELQEMGLTMCGASKILKKSESWLGRKVRENRLDVFEVIAIAADLRRHIGGMEKVDAYKTYVKNRKSRRQSEISRATRERWRELEWDATMWG